MMSDDQLLRYSRQIMLPQIDITGQDKLLSAHVVIVGLGGLGCPAATYLVTAGVGRLTLVDPDIVDLTNLQRQVLYTQSDIEKPKAKAAADRLNSINPDIRLTPVTRKLSTTELLELCEVADVVIDATDYFESRFAINKACVKSKTPLVSGAAIRFNGQLTVFDNRKAQGPCYRCLYSDDITEELSCSESGILGPVVGTIGTLQAMETIKLIADLSTSLQGQLMIFDGETMEWQRISFSQDPLCPVCNSQVT